MFNRYCKSAYRLSAVVFIGGVFFAGARGAAAQESAGPAFWAPKDTALFVEIANYKAFNEKYKKTPLSRAGKDDKTSQAAGSFIEMFDKALAKYAKRLGIEDIKKLNLKPEGPAAIIVTVQPTKELGRDEEMGFAMVADWGSNHDKLEELLSKITKHVVDNGGEKQTKTIAGHRITTLKLAESVGEDDEAQEISPLHQVLGPIASLMDPKQSATSFLKDASPEEISFTSIGKVTIFGSTVDVVKEIAGRVEKKSEDTLATTDDYKSLKRHCAPLGDLNMLVNIPHLIKVLEAAGDEDRKALIRSLGLKSLRSYVGTVALATKGGAALEMRGFLPIQGKPQGIVKLLTEDVANKPVSPKGGIPASSLTAGWLNLNFGAIMEEIYEIVWRVDAEKAEVWRNTLIVPIPGEDGETEMIDAEEILSKLSSPLRGFVSAAAPYGKENVTMMFSLKHKDRETLAKIFEIIGPFFVQRDLMGQAVYDLMIPPIGISIALTDSNVVVGSTSAVDEAVRTGGKMEGAGLAKDKQFQRAARLAPRQAWMVIYNDDIKRFAASLALHKKAGEAGENGENGDDAVPVMGTDIGSKVVQGLKEHPALKLDNPESMKKYQSSSLLTATKTPQGIQFYMNVLFPK